MRASDWTEQIDETLTFEKARQENVHRDEKVARPAVVQVVAVCVCVCVN